MLSTVLPLPTVVFQALFLLVAIAIEAFVLRQELKTTPRQAVQYATSINLFSTATGWLVFFAIQPLLPLELKNQLLNFIFFDRWSSNIAFWVILAGFVTFFGTFFVEVFGLNQLQVLMMTPQEWQARREANPNRYRLGQRRKERLPDSNAASAILTANALSYSAILLILFARLIVEDIYFKPF